jgi:hypothetical protein
MHADLLITSNVASGRGGPRGWIQITPAPVSGDTSKVRGTCTLNQDMTGTTVARPTGTIMGLPGGLSLTLSLLALGILPPATRKLGSSNGIAHEVEAKMHLGGISVLKGRQTHLPAVISIPTGQPHLRIANEDRIPFPRVQGNARSREPTLAVHPVGTT